MTRSEKGKNMGKSEKEKIWVKQNMTRSEKGKNMRGSAK